MAKSKVIKTMTKKEALKVKAVQAALDLCDGKLAKVTFIRKSGELSSMNCRLDVKKHLKGGVSTANKSGGQITVYKMDGVNSAYRSFYGQSVVSIECGNLSAKFD